MKVRDLMARLAQMDPDALVRFPDTYAENEGWGDADTLLTVLRVVDEGDTVILTGDW